MKQFLHVGCGPKRKDQTTRGFNRDEWLEIRFDIDETVNPDIVGTMTDMAAIADESMDAIFSSHNIEHLYVHELPTAIGEFLRILKPDGFLVVTCPDLQAVCAAVAEDRLLEPLYTAPCGAIAPFDMLYGLRSAMASGNLFMAHRCGFTAKTLIGTLQANGFGPAAYSKRGHPAYDLWALATRVGTASDQLRSLALEHLPRSSAV